MGSNVSQLEKDIGIDRFPANEHYFGLVNFGNTCYCNSVLQALYFCQPFRKKVLQSRIKSSKRNNTTSLNGTSGSSNGNANKETILTCLADLFYTLSNQKKKTGSYAPKKFINRLRKENEVFDNYMQQDAHEFLNYLLNTIADLLRSEMDDKQAVTWIQEIFQGTLTNETRCLNCESVSSKDEDFIDLSIDVEQNTSLTHCLRVFSKTETLGSEHKYYCEKCCSKQEAQKRMRIKKPPKILALHLKRFKYVEVQNRHTKLTSRVVFPLELRIFNDDFQNEYDDKLYDLFAAVIHCGAGPNRGHYISIVKSHGFWLAIDDDYIEKLDTIR